MDQDANKRISKTYKEAVDEWYIGFCSASPLKGAIPSPHMAHLFAEWMDKFNFVDPQLTIFAMQKVMQIDREFTKMILEELVKFDPEAPKRLAEKVTSMHRHTKVPTEAPKTDITE